MLLQSVQQSFEFADFATPPVGIHREQDRQGQNSDWDQPEDGYGIFSSRSHSNAASATASRIMNPSAHRHS